MSAGVTGAIALAQAYARTRWLQASLFDRARVEARRVRGLEALRRHAIANTAFYRRLGDIPFASFPVVTKADVMAAYHAFNVAGLTADEAWRMIDRGETPPGYDLGCSTGTSGNRGLYLVSDRERFVWLGTIVAKAIPDVLRRRHRVAIILPRASRLYDAANESKLIKLQFFDLRKGLDVTAEGVQAFQPTIVVGPPKALRWMAEQGTRITPERIYSSAEVLDAPDRARIEAAFGLRLGEIYMATEGLLGVSCKHGTLHLAEDAVHFEYEPVGDASGLVTPIITDFTRRTQVMARYRMNDLLRLSHERCACGSVLQAVTEVVGRQDDCFELPNSRDPSRRATLTPDVIRNAVLSADQEINDFRVFQTAWNEIELVLSLEVTDAAAATAVTALRALCKQLGCVPVVHVRRSTLAADPAVKLRRVARRMDGKSSSAVP